MGYTHYWRQTTNKALPKTKWNAFQKDIKTVLDNLPENGVNDYTREEPLSIDVKTNSDNVFHFNAVEEEFQHECFYFERKHEDDFNFCKTARKPYDYMVIASLLLVEKHFPKKFEISSDGDVQEWSVVQAVLKEIGIDTKIPKGV